MFEWYEAEVGCLERTLAQETACNAPVVFYGSSTLRLWTTLNRDFPGICVRNAGFGGSTLSACVYYFERLVLPLKPRSLVIYAGDNDLGDGQSPEAVFASYLALWRKCRAQFPSIPVAYISIKPSPARWSIDDRIRRANALIRQEVERQEKTCWIDIYPAMLGDDGKPKRELYEEDGLHLSPAGYRVWTERIGAFQDKIF